MTPRTLNRRRFEVRLFIFVLLIALLSDTAVASVRKDWKQAVKLDTLEGYEKFLADYPEDKHTALALERVESLSWAVATQTNDESGYTAFVERFPKSLYVGDANERMQELIGLRATVLLKGTDAAALREFLEEHDDHAAAHTVEARLSELLWPAIKQSNDGKQVRKFRKEFTETPEGAEAHLLADNLEWARAISLSTIDALSTYLRYVTAGDVAGLKAAEARDLLTLSVQKIAEAKASDGVNDQTAPIAPDEILAVLDAIRWPAIRSSCEAAPTPGVVSFGQNRQEFSAGGTVIIQSFPGESVAVYVEGDTPIPIEADKQWVLTFRPAPEPFQAGTCSALFIGKLTVETDFSYYLFENRWIPGSTNVAR